MANLYTMKNHGIKCQSFRLKVLKKTRFSRVKNKRKENGDWGTRQKKVYHYDEQGNKIYDKEKKTYQCSTEKTTDWDSNSQADISFMR
ncbi:hypothetical protein [Lactococcus cremoris]|uniref:hypothetical protein n=1 Tax=Lactococcus lactis subsp. cremoris TaxID=1359 RepID=UPI0021825648|nr:hypothetical protein [Lactococcus cremoris]MCT0451218.1 hypothetical protein [Lactococcus cremoris]